MIDFDTDTGGGSVGPWVRWQAEGTKDRAVPPNAFSIRERPEGATKYVTSQFQGFAVGVAIDLDSVKQGWQKDNGFGQAPTKDFTSRNRPSDEKKLGGQGHAWSRMFSCRVAYDGGKKAATWEDASWGGYEGFRRLVEQVKTAIGADPNKATQSPVVRMTGVEHREFNTGRAVIPVLEITKWVPKPAILSPAPAAASFETTPAAPPPPPPPQPAPAADLDDF